ncbi:MAG: hypothetical protein JWQ78_896 [Sediminibacterium sp.]|nr:hypothetical protein [Sediminibacterium sp.]
MRKIARYLPILGMLLLLSACQVMLIGAYDEVTDQGFQKIQNDLSGLLISIDKNLSDPAETPYAKYKSAYAGIEGQIESIRIRCYALPKYQLVRAHADQLQSSVISLEKFHKLGIGPGDSTSLRIIKRTFDVEFKAVIQLQNGLKREKISRKEPLPVQP